ncbi:MAG: DUF3880 domain-containing protein [Lachnospiraceae bacterium]|nr:DUF3880 domain-containing protein [Lachnospiraceae bacterium]
MVRNVLLYKWNANNEPELESTLKEIGLNVISVKIECTHYTRDLNLAGKLVAIIQEKKVDAVVSFDYFPIISAVCHGCHVPYYSYVYDCPHNTLFAGQVTLPENHIYIFDRELEQILRSYGIQTVSHLPLAVSTDAFQKTIRKADEKQKRKFSAEVSFVGSLYENNSYYDKLKELVLAEEAKRMEDAIDRQLFSYKQNTLLEDMVDHKLDLSFYSQKAQEIGVKLDADYFIEDIDLVIPTIFEKEVSRRERKQFLNRVAEKHDLNIYTASPKEEVPHAVYRGIADYHNEMPVIFANSKINLNLTLRSIRSGIPLRVLDILACGGFCLTNWQPEIEEYFSPGRELETFGSLEEGMEKIEFYLTHNDMRMKIAERGLEKVKDKFGFDRFTGMVMEGIE